MKETTLTLNILFYSILSAINNLLFLYLCFHKLSKFYKNQENDFCILVEK